jgi:hypothetical protein
MSFTRRTFLQAGAALPLLGSLPTLAKSELSLGSATLTTVSDGNLVLPANFIF